MFLCKHVCELLKFANQHNVVNISYTLLTAKYSQQLSLRSAVLFTINPALIIPVVTQQM